MITAVLLSTYISLILGLNTILENRNKKLFYSFIGGFTGIIIFYFFYGFLPVNPSNIGWLLHSGDLTQHYYGWLFFRNDPWTFPITVSSSLGYPYGMSIIYTDSIPIFAIIFKLIRGILPSTFQYFGIWGLLCFFMQGFFASMLVYQLSTDLWMTLISPLFFCTSNILISRMFGHDALAGQWLVLFAFYLFFNDSQKNHLSKLWLAALLISIGVHAYLFGMVLIIFFGTLLQRIIRTKSVKSILLFCGISTFILILWMWILGYFYGQMLTDIGGLGSFQTNLNSFINPLGKQWSIFLSPLPTLSKNGEGFNYLGMGVIFLFIIALVSGLVNRKEHTVQKQFLVPGILAISIFFIFFSLSNSIALNDHTIIIFHLPKILNGLWSTFRSTGRMLWPVFYLVMLFPLIQLPSKIKRSSLTLLIVLGSFLLQYIDECQIWENRKVLNNYVGTVQESANQQTLNAIAQNYHSMNILPLSAIHWEPLTYLAATNKMTINYSYFARDNKKTLQKARKDINQLIRGHVDPNTLYIIEDDAIFSELCDEFDYQTLFLDIDGIRIIAPDYYNRGNPITGLVDARTEICKKPH